MASSALIPQSSVQTPFCELSSPSPSQPVQNLFGSLHSLYPDPNLPVYLTTHLTSLPRPFSASLPSPHCASLYPDPNLQVYLTLQLQAYPNPILPVYLALNLPGSLPALFFLYSGSLSRPHPPNLFTPYSASLSSNHLAGPHHSPVYPEVEITKVWQKSIDFWFAHFFSGF